MQISTPMLRDFTARSRDRGDGEARRRKRQRVSGLTLSPKCRPSTLNYSTQKRYERHVVAFYAVRLNYCGELCRSRRYEILRGAEEKKERTVCVKQFNVSESYERDIYVRRLK